MVDPVDPLFSSSILSPFTRRVDFSGVSLCGLCVQRGFIMNETIVPHYNLPFLKIVIQDVEQEGDIIPFSGWYM